MKKFLLTYCVFFIFSLALKAQTTFPINGVYDPRDKVFAFVNATIHISPDQVVNKGTLVIKDGKIQAAGAGVTVPDNAVIVEMDGKHIYPSFIDVFSNYGMPEPKAEGEAPRSKPQMLSNKRGAYAWNETLRPEVRAHKWFKVADGAAELRKYGFGAVVTHYTNGMSRGTSTLVSLGEGKEHELILKDMVASQLSFNKGKSTQSYPSSLMGGIALLRQTYLDADWYKKEGHKEQHNISLEAWNECMKLKSVFEVRDRLDMFRAAKIGKEFGQKYILKGKGDEYMRINDIKALGSPLIVPLSFPKPYDVSNPYDAMQISLTDMKHWELAPTNPGVLAKAGIPFAFTAYGLKDKSAYLKNIRKAIKHGLSEKDALRAMTVGPAKIMGIESLVGTLEKGKHAHFIITDKKLFEKGATIHQNWVGGKGYVLKAFEEKADLGRGVYRLNVGKKQHDLEITFPNDKPKYVIRVNDSTEIKVKHSFERGILSLSFKENKDAKAATKLIGTVKNTKAEGRGQRPDGTWVDWSMGPTRALPQDEEKKKEDASKENKKEYGEITYPFLPYGWTSIPDQGTYLLKNGTVWTNEREGILKDADVLIQNGKIAKVGKGLSASGAITIDATGKHITCGIIDEHSHIAISRGVNEGTQYSSAEVSISDVVNSEDVNIYRQLAGGVTAAQLLHGSANPIGGQSALIKMRWGFLPEEMKIKNTDSFIKFALGENVKQSNWGDEYRIRFPQSRMGVEAVFDDHFTRAAEYGKLKRSGKPYRKDLEMETLLEIIEKKRFITCHSYVQSEINMLMKVAERHGFILNTFTHILEGYKVADKMKAHGAGASTFSDWWAYKYEVIDAIPYNAAILNRMGVVTAINSDDAEMARRLNQEAAKGVMYGDMSEEDAWKMVTLNPAILLHLDSRMGSLKAGKDADVVLWSDNPLSIYAQAEMTFVDGRKLFDKKEDLEHREAIRKERARLMQKMVAAKNGGASTQPPSMKYHHHYHCDHIEDEMGEHHHHEHHEEGHHHQGHHHQD